MKQFKQQKITELQKNLADKIKNLRYAITTLPAYARRKKDKKNWETFFTIFAFTALIGIFICGTGGWLAVAVSGTLLALIIVESGLFLSLAIGFSAWPVYNIYLWTRDLFSSEKIKSQNKQYDQCQKNLLELKELAAEKNYLFEKIYLKLNNAIKCISAQGTPDFVQLDLRDQIQRLEQKKKNHPAYSRKQKDKENWPNIKYLAIISGIGIVVYFTVLVIIPLIIQFGSTVPVLLMFASILISSFVGVVMVSSLLQATFLWMRDLFSSAEIKAENKEYAQLEKIIAELKKLDKQNSQLDEEISSKLEFTQKNFPTAEDEKLSTVNLAENLKSNDKENNNNFSKYGTMFSAVSANQTMNSLGSTATPTIN